MSYVYPISSSKSKAIENTNIHLLDNTSSYHLSSVVFWIHSTDPTCDQRYLKESLFKAKFYLFNLKISLSYSLLGTSKTKSISSGDGIFCLKKKKC